MSVDSGSGYRLRPSPRATTIGGGTWQKPSTPAGDEMPVSRIMVALAAFLVFGLILCIQLVRYQVFGVVPKVANPATAFDPFLPRGSIVDRNGHPLAMETYRYMVIADPALIIEYEIEDEVAEQLAPILTLEPGDIRSQIADHSDSHYLPLGEVGPNLGESIIAWQAFTVTAEARPYRYYPEGNLMAHALGFVAGDRVGYYGVEGYYDTFLRATTRVPRLLDAPVPDDQQWLPLPESPFVPSYVQQDLVLTIDRMIQHLAETRLKEAIAEHEAESGTIIVLEPNTSAVLAMASYPDYNPNDHTYTKDNAVYANPAISLLYEPGSVFKLITFAAALDREVVTPKTRYLDEDRFIFGEREIRNWDKKGRGEVTVQEALAQSLNVTTAKIAVDLKASEFYKYVKRFGIGQITGIELQNESAGIVKAPGTNNWYPADLATNAFGQGISVTPLQMANAVAAIASGGVVHRAHIVQQIIDGPKLKTVQPQAMSIAISPQTAKTMTEMMVNTVENMPTVKIPGYAIAGKSGTAEIPITGEGYADDLTITSFAGFFPADDPQYVILVKLVRPQSSRWATWNAAPLFRNVVKDIIDLYSIPPDAVRLNAMTN